jgi:predicted TPR repeat methyltransferase
VEAAARALRPGGLLAFTVERAEAGEAPGGFGLRHHGRYCHEEEYLRSCLVAAGLAPRPLETATLRSEGGEPVAGFVVLALRAAA